jgi:hypothetical protein
LLKEPDRGRVGARQGDFWGAGSRFSVATTILYSGIAVLESLSFAFSLAEIQGPSLNSVNKRKLPTFSFLPRSFLAWRKVYSGCGGRSVALRRTTENPHN